MTNLPQEPAINLEVNEQLARRLIVDFIRNETGKFGINRVVVGLSGGVDSALATFLAVEALGAANVLALIMPYCTSSTECERDAVDLAHSLGILHRRIDITPMVEPLFQLLPDMSAKRRGNVMARIRMTVLFDQSEAFGPSIVLGTSNKTEALVGYFTLYGDAAAGIEPISDLYKTQVWQMARAVKLPESIVARAPSAELWPGQTDEGELGLTYTELDKILYLMIDRRHSLDQITQMGFDGERVLRVAKMIRDTEFKRHLPVAAKVSSASVAHDLSFPRDWGR